VLAVWLICMAGAHATALDVDRPDVRLFIAHVAQQDSFSSHRLRKLLKAAQSQESIIEAMDRPAEKAKLWYEYRAIFVNEKRIEEGVEFWTLHRAELERASAATGVPAEYIVAILGVETYYGRLTGRYRVLDALATLAFDYPARAKFFQDELEQFLILSREAAIDPLTAMGSYAGAMGAPQFMPSTYRHFAVDADHDGRIDLWTNWPDIFVSVGNYLREHGWNTGGPVLTDASIERDSPETLDGRKLELAETVASLRAQGIRFETALPGDAPVLLIAADEPDGIHWRVGYQNFYTITRYNHSALYAMAVYELAAAVKARLVPAENPPALAAPVSVPAAAPTPDPPS
jgi:membrane-bound lytic murein transglycosylase B